MVGRCHQLSQVTAPPGMATSQEEGPQCPPFSPRPIVRCSCRCGGGHGVVSVVSCRSHEDSWGWAPSHALVGHWSVHCFGGDCLPLYCWVVFIYSAHKSFVKYTICKYFLPLCGWSFTFLTASFNMQALHPVEVPCACRCFCHSCTGVMSIRTPHQRSEDLPYIFFKELVTFRSVIHLS